MAKQYHQVNCSNAVLCLETQHNQYTPLQPLMMEKHYCLSDKGKVLIFINFLCLSIVSLVTPFLAFFFSLVSSESSLFSAINTTSLSSILCPSPDHSTSQSVSTTKNQFQMDSPNAVQSEEKVPGRKRGQQKICAFSQPQMHPITARDN